MSTTTATTKQASMTSKDGSKTPSSSMMVMTSIKALADRKGSSLMAIKKYISAHFKVDVVKKAPFLCKAIRSAVEKANLRWLRSLKKPKSPTNSAEKKSTKSKTLVKKAPKKKIVKSSTSKKSAEKKTTKKAPAKKTPSKNV
ncbi:H1_5 [Lepeophtheirus salmonis]|uniref:H1_5 n=1 Tax=Lepeophtheirus salmonis TaxID=72036 RepID=A0A7R8D488_LEPSM|nr:H1_5 [Lepeophtheirus salmonis]CAF3023915.1 H1_5 [Lepeophtheirus salmonis]